WPEYLAIFGALISMHFSLRRIGGGVEQLPHRFSKNLHGIWNGANCPGWDFSKIPCRCSSGLEDPWFNSRAGRNSSSNMTSLLANWMRGKSACVSGNQTYSSRHPHFHRLTKSFLWRRPPCCGRRVVASITVLPFTMKLSL